MQWFVYLLECADGTLYCGITNNLPRRLAQHNGDVSGGAKYTRGRRPVRVVAQTTCVSKGAALRLEHVVQALPKEKKIPFLQQSNT